MHVGRKHEWTEREKMFLERNWNVMRTVDIAKVLKCSPTTILHAGSNMNLPPKRSTNRNILTVNSIKKYKKNFEIGQFLKLEIKRSKRKYLYFGKVIAITDFLVTLQRENGIKDSFKYHEFINGDIKILRRESK